jgi:acyl transferase domain-containing protein
VNARDRVVVSGTPAAVASLQDRLTEMHVHCSRLDISRAYHSHLVEPGLAGLMALIDSVPRMPPRLRYISSLTGTWADPTRVMQPSYWAEQMRHTVEFVGGIKRLLSENFEVFVEAGPNQNLGRTIRDLGTGVPTIVSSMRNVRADVPEPVLPRSMGELWLAGVNIDWDRVYAGTQTRVELPPYPLQRERFWIDARAPEPSINRPHEAPPSDAIIMPEAKTTAPAAPPQATAGRADRRARWVAPRNRIESTVAAIWSEVLGASDIGMEDDFLELGGDSLLATLILSKIRRAFDTDVSMETMLSSATVESVAREVQLTLDSETGAARTPSPRAYCAFEVMIGDECVTVHLNEEDYRTQGVPDGALNFRVCS